MVALSVAPPFAKLQCNRPIAYTQPTATERLAHLIHEIAILKNFISIRLTLINDVFHFLSSVREAHALKLNKFIDQCYARHLSRYIISLQQVFTACKSRGDERTLQDKSQLHAQNTQIMHVAKPVEKCRDDDEKRSP